MKEELVSFEVAVLAKEKGFNWITNDFYPDLSWNSKELYHFNNSGFHSYEEVQFIESWGDIILAPTQSLLQKWLREIHKVECGVHPVRYYGDAFTSYYQSLLNNCTINVRIKHSSYEAAMEDSLKEGLKLIE